MSRVSMKIFTGKDLETDNYVTDSFFIESSPKASIIRYPGDVVSRPIQDTVILRKKSEEDPG